MLTETFLAASSSPVKLASAPPPLKDAGIFLHRYQPQPALETTFKKSATRPNCIAISNSHIFAAQADKAVVHVYNTEKGNQEATVPFPERITSLALAAEDTVLVLGTERGRLICWDTSSGRQVSTSASHLHAVDSLVVDPSSNYVLSASADATVLVWSLVDLLAFSAGHVRDAKEPRHALTGHDGAITALATGHSEGLSNIVVSASKDKTVMVWDYISGTQLRTFLLKDAPVCLRLDPADRAAYTGFADGSVQRIDFLSASTTSPLDSSLATTPIQPPRSSRWSYTSPTDEASAELASTLCISVSYDGTTLLSGHANGSICSWDTSTGRFGKTEATYTGAPITYLSFQEPIGFPRARELPLSVPTIVKPRPHESFSSASGEPNEHYVLNLSLPSSKPDLRTARPRKRRRISTSSFDTAISTPGFPTSTLQESLLDLHDWLTTSTVPPKSTVKANAKARPNVTTSRANTDPTLDLNSDFLPLSTSSNNDENEIDSTTLPTLRTRITDLESNLRTLQKERNDLALREASAQKRRAIKLRRREERSQRGWEEMGRRQRVERGVGRVGDEDPVSGTGDGEGDVEEKDDTISTTSGSSDDEPTQKLLMNGRGKKTAKKRRKQISDADEEMDDASSESFADFDE